MMISQSLRPTQCSKTKQRLPPSLRLTRDVATQMAASGDTKTFLIGQEVTGDSSIALDKINTCQFSVFTLNVQQLRLFIQHVNEIFIYT